MVVQAGLTETDRPLVVRLASGAKTEEVCRQQSVELGTVVPIYQKITTACKGRGPSPLNRCKQNPLDFPEFSSVSFFRTAMTHSV